VEAFESFVALALEIEGLVVSEAMKFDIARQTTSGLQAHGYEVDLVGARHDLLVLASVKSYFGSKVFIGSEGTLGIITDAWLRLVPAPEVATPMAATFATTREGCAALLTVVGSGLCPAALEFLDAGALAAARAAFPVRLDERARFMVIVEADGDQPAVDRLMPELRQILAAEALDVYQPRGRGETARFWRWRDGVSLAVEAERGGKVSEDVTVPLDRLEEMIDETVAIGERHGLPACSWGHGGDGNLYSTFLLDPGDPEATRRAAVAAEDLFETAARLHGSISGEHGVGWASAGTCISNGHRQPWRFTTPSSTCSTR
jgi:FAD/FMN-containing dehydrogenase